MFVVASVRVDVFLKLLYFVTRTVDVLTQWMERCWFDFHGKQAMVRDGVRSPKFCSLEHHSNQPKTFDTNIIRDCTLC